MTNSAYYASRPRTNVKVRADFLPDGTLRPIKFKGPDDQVYVIDRILDVRNAASYGGGGQGIRYTVRVGEQVLYLFYNSQVWWVDKENKRFT